MRILEAIQKFSNTADSKSTTEIIFNMSKNLSDRGHEVTIYTTNYKLDHQKIQDLEKCGVKFYILKIIIDIGNFMLTPCIINDLSVIKQYDIIHLHNYRTFQNVIIAFYANFFKIPYILQAEGSLTTFYQKKYSKILFDYIFGNRIILNATKVIAASEQESRQYLELGVSMDKIIIIPYAIDINDYIHLPEKGLFKQKYNVNWNKKIILYLGRIHKMKGLEILLFSFSDLQKEDYDTLLIIAGPDDGYLEELYRIIEKLDLKDKIIVLGPLYDFDKLEAYMDADVFVLPSFHDDFGLVTAEAMTCGTPVIVTDQCGSADIVREGAGIVCECSSPSLFLAMKQMLDREETRKAYGETGRILMKEKYTWEKITERLERVYSNVVKEWEHKNIKASE